jgi:uncharacterized membrane protein YecN with MAPEG domain
MAIGWVRIERSRAPDAAQRLKRVYARLRRAMALAKRCAAEPGSRYDGVRTGVPALRSGMKNAAPRPGHVRTRPVTTLSGGLHANAIRHRLLSRPACADLCGTRARGRAAAAGKSCPVRDGENFTLRSAIRAHANFIEYVPIIALLVAMLEMSGSSAARVHVLMGALLVARLLHPLGMYSKPGTWQFSAGRVGGIMITISVLIAAALSALSRFWPAIGGH